MMTGRLEEIVARELGAALRLSPAGELAESEHLRNFESALERWIPERLGWQDESLDGFRFCSAPRRGPREAEFLGLALLLSDQSWTPVWLRIQLKAEADVVASFECRLGERGDGRDGLLRVPYGSRGEERLLSALPERANNIDWVYRG